MVGILSIQMKSVINNKNTNLEKVKNIIEQNLDKKPDLVVLPEFFSSGISHISFKNYPEDENGGETVNFIKELAKKYNTNIVAGTVIEKSNDKLYNTTFVIDRNGNTVGKYRKIHLYNYMGGNEGELITAGNEEVVVDLDIGKVGLAICFDIRYPMHFKKLAKMGAEIVVLPTAWLIPTEVYEAPETAQEMWISMNRTRAYDNMFYLVICNQTGKLNSQRATLGTSLIISPTAEILARADFEQNAIYAQIDMTIPRLLKSCYPIADID